MPKVDFREFQDVEARNEGPQAKSYTQRRCTEVGMMFAYHLDGRLGTHVRLVVLWHRRGMGSMTGKSGLL